MNDRFTHAGLQSDVKRNSFFDLIETTENIPTLRCMSCGAEEDRVDVMLIGAAITLCGGCIDFLKKMADEYREEKQGSKESQPGANESEG